MNTAQRENPAIEVRGLSKRFGTDHPDASAVLGNIDWRVALILTVAVIPGARVGAALALRASDIGLRRAGAVFLGLIAVVYAGGELLSLAS